MNRTPLHTTRSLLHRWALELTARARGLKQEPERGDVPAFVFITVGTIVIALAVIVVLTTVVNNQLGRIPGT